MSTNWRKIVWQLSHHWAKGNARCGRSSNSLAAKCQISARVLSRASQKHLSNYLAHCGNDIQENASMDIQNHPFGFGIHEDSLGSSLEMFREHQSICHILVFHTSFLDKSIECFFIFSFKQDCLRKLQGTLVRNTLWTVLTHVVLLCTRHGKGSQACMSM